MKPLHSFLGSFMVAVCMTSFTPAQPAARLQTETPAASPPTTDAATSNALLHVYRARRYVGSALAPSLYVDDKEVVRVGNGRRATIRLSAGTHTVRSDDKSSAISLEAKAGQEFYIRVDEETGFWKGHGKLTLLMPEQGSAEYKLQKPVEQDRAIAKEMLIEDAGTSAEPAHDKKDK
jgi:uncharacterized protein DUF2846